MLYNLYNNMIVNQKAKKYLKADYISYCVSSIAYRVGNKIDYNYAVGAQWTVPLPFIAYCLLWARCIVPLHYYFVYFLGITII